MRKLILLMVFFTAGCGSANLTPPIVDMSGVDQVKLNRDLAECTRETNDSPVVFHPAQRFDNCMKRKGYTILVGSN